MAKCLVGANGGGKVMVDGLTAGVVIKDAEISVKQGAKELQSVIGSLDVLATFGHVGGQGQGYTAYYWNGSSYSKLSAWGGTSFTFAGTPAYVYFKCDPAQNIGGISSTGTAGIVKVTDPSRKTIGLTGWISGVVLGYK